MGMLNDHVRMGAPLGAVLPFTQRTEFKSLGRIRMADLAPMMAQPQPLVQPLELVGILGGGGLASGSFLVKDKSTRMMMLIAGAVGAGAGLISAVVRALSGPAPLPYPALPVTPTSSSGSPGNLVQTLTSDYQNFSPVVKQLKNLI